MMRFFKRIFLFLIVNFLVVTTIAIVLSIFNVRPYISQWGISYTDLLITCFVWGMGGAFISLSLSRIMAKWMMGIKLIDQNTRDPHLHTLRETVHHLARKAKLKGLPEVGIYQSNDPNAFATGPTQRRSLVAVSTGLLEKMDAGQLEGVLAHEITHIANGDMVTMTLLQGIVNAFVLFLSRLLALLLSGFGRGDRRGSAGSFYLFTILFQTVFMVLGSLIVFWFSRKREFAADAGGAHLAGKEKMISALEGLQRFLPKHQTHTAKQEALQTFKISTPSRSGWARLFASHPPLDERIMRLRSIKTNKFF